jgi:hypothetical protein
MLFGEVTTVHGSLSFADLVSWNNNLFFWFGFILLYLFVARDIPFI